MAFQGMSSDMRLSLAFVIGFAATAHASAAELRPAMQTAVTCVYDMVRSRHGVLSTDVYAIGKTEYVVEYRFRNDAGSVFIGGIGIWSDKDADGNYSYTNDTPSGQADDNGSVELGFLGDKFIDNMYSECHLFPTLMDTMTLPAEPEPPTPIRERVTMPSPAKQ
jgi:hypothetical protein